MRPNHKIFSYLGLNHDKWPHVTSRAPSAEAGDVGASVGSFKSPRTGAVIPVYPKRGESTPDAMARVRARHGA
jgi:hypothetical protein